ncbi:Stress response protein YsnF [bioreactor metagenome]|uniref:Stress response protein YsnF n=1 Tax=bioreactor metagenome TaxID=1076179 RepID=A0A645FHD2_9ZZZZ
MIRIKEEQLDIAKRWVETGDVKIYKETYTKEKSFTIPVVCEELVIEKITFPSSNIGNQEVEKEFIRIPLSEEQIEFRKKNVALENVSVYKEKIEEIKHIEETLNKERARLKISGSPQIIDESR